MKIVALRITLQSGMAIVVTLPEIEARKYLESFRGGRLPDVVGSLVEQGPWLIRNSAIDAMQMFDIETLRQMEQQQRNLQSYPRGSGAN